MIITATVSENLWWTYKLFYFSSIDVPVMCISVLHGPGLGPRAGPARSPRAGPGQVSIIVCGPGRVRA